MTISRHNSPAPMIERCAAYPGRSLIFWMKFLYRIQLSVAEINLITNTILEKRPCRFLVFGLGNDSWFWHLLNQDGTTVFLEDNPRWMERILGRHPKIQAYRVDYKTRRQQWRQLLSQPELLMIPLPESLLKPCWDVILVDGPNGWRDIQPGRMKSIYMASKLTSPDGHIFVHDCNRTVERTYSSTFLLDGRWSTRVGRLCHFHAASMHQSRSVLAGAPAESIPHSLSNPEQNDMNRLQYP